MLDYLLDLNFAEPNLIKSAKLFKCLTFLDQNCSHSWYSWENNGNHLRPGAAARLSPAA
jgi:hypothetical protein